MKQKINLLFATILLTTSSVATFALVANPTDPNKANNYPFSPINNNSIENVDTKTAEQYANETAIVNKSLLIGKNQGFNTNPLLNNMYQLLPTSNINNLTPINNTANDFINHWTQNLNATSINTIQALYQRNGIKQPEVEKINRKINEYKNDATYLPQIKNYLTNSNLSNPIIMNLIDNSLKNKKLVPNISEILSYIKYDQLLFDAINECLTDWDQQSQFSGATALDCMHDYMSKKGTISEAWQNTNRGWPNWYYVQMQASNWNWNNDFYEYMAGVNFNYLFKKVSGKYLGDMLTENITLNPLAKHFNDQQFAKTFQAALDKIINNPNTWPYLVKAIIPIIKIKFLNLDNPTLGIKNITWDNPNPIAKNTKQVVELKTILTKLQHFLSPEGRSDLINLIASLLGGPFGEDIIITVYPLDNPLCYTLPEVFKTYSWFISLNDIASQVVDQLRAGIENLEIPKWISKIVDFTNKYLTNNPIIDLQDLASYLNVTFGSAAFSTALANVKDIIENPTTTTHSAQEIFALLGVQLNNNKFKENSVLDNLTKWLATPNSTINQILGIFQDNKSKTGIINNMLLKQQKLRYDLYEKYFDLDNSRSFSINKIQMKKYHHDNGAIEAILTYQLSDKSDNKVYDISYVNNDFANNQNFKLTQFTLSKS